MDHGFAAVETEDDISTQSPQQCHAAADSRYRARQGRHEKERRQFDLATQIRPSFNSTQKVLTSISGEPGVCSWLTAEPQLEYDLVL